MSNYEETIVRFYTKFTQESFGNFTSGDKAFLKKNSDGRLVLHRTDGPACEYSSGSKEWWFEGKRHRTDGPAFELFNGDKEWYFEGKIHRTDGPAVELFNGRKYWWIEGICYSEEDFNKKISEMNTAKNSTNSCNNKIVEIEGKKYKLIEV